MWPKKEVKQMRKGVEERKSTCSYHTGWHRRCGTMEAGRMKWTGTPRPNIPPSLPSSFLSHESFAAPLISPPFPLLYGNGRELCTVDTVLNKADNSNNKERNARITFILRGRKREGGMDGGMEEEKNECVLKTDRHACDL